MGYRDVNPNSSPDRPFWGQSNPTRPASGPEGAVTADPLGPGYYQTRGRGNKSGRVSPRQQTRASSRDLTLAKHGLIDQGAADPNQGQLFNADEVVGPRRTDQQIISDQNINMATGMLLEKDPPKKDGVQAEGPPKVTEMEFGGARGFMPNLNDAQKVRALQSAQDARLKAGTHRGAGTGTTAQMMEDRTAARNQTGDQPWYQGVNSQGENQTGIQGQAHEQIERKAAATGVSHGAMTRAAAITSPQSAWDKGVVGGHEHRYPNLNHANEVVKAAEVAAPYADIHEVREIGGTVPTSDGGLGTMGAKAAGVHLAQGSDATDMTRIRSPLSQKVPNFRASLHLSDDEPAARRMAAQSYTVDRHDVRAAGIDSGDIENKQGLYDVAAMTGTRVAHKNRTLAPNEQAREWVGVRGPNQHESEHEGLFKSGTTAGRVEVNPNALPSGRAPGNTSRLSNRKQSTAERMGLEF